jgi:hypothetical protein
MGHAQASRPIGLFLLAVALSLLGGCAIPTIDFGSPPPTEPLATLTPRVSTDADVLKAIGEPQGRGIVEHRPNERPRDVWFYYFATNVGMDVKGKYLFVFLDGNVYDGFLWFSSDVAMRKQ